MLPESVYMLIGTKHRRILPDVSFDADGLTIEICIKKMQEWIKKRGYTGVDKVDAHIVEISRPEYKAVTVCSVTLMDDGKLIVNPYDDGGMSEINENKHARVFLQQTFERIVKEAVEYRND